MTGPQYPTPGPRPDPTHQAGPVPPSGPQAAPGPQSAPEARLVDAPPDPVWNDYLAAVRGLADLPRLADERRQAAREEEAEALRRANATLDAAVNRCAEWQAQAKRAISTAEAKLVAARVLVPDATAAPTITYDAPEPLVQSMLALEEQLATEVNGLREARRLGRARARERAAEAAYRAARRREMTKLAAAIGLIILGAILLGVVF